MDDISNFYSESDSDSGEVNNESSTTTTATTTANSKLLMSASSNLAMAPVVDISTMETGHFHSRGDKEILYNPKADELFAPISGPLPDGITREEAFKPAKTTLTGHVEIDHMDEFTFHEQYHTFQNMGYAVDPSKGVTVDRGKHQYIGDKEALKKNRATTVFNASNAMDKSRKEKSRKRFKRGDPGDIGGYLGPWAPHIVSEEDEKKWKDELEKRKEEWQREHPEHDRKKKRRKLNNGESSSDEDGESGDEETEEKIQAIQSKRKQQYEEQLKLESTEFHGESTQDYQGRTYMHCPSELRKREAQAKYYIPKKKIHDFIGHKKGVNAIKFFPKTGHLLLSCSNDTTCKIWDVYNDRRCLRTYRGHTAGVRNICWSRDGSKFLTTGYDRWMKLWDTETGKVIWRGTSGKLAFDAKLYPENENEFLCGQKNKIAVQWDMRANKIVQRYEEHLSAVNTVTFIDNNRRFTTTSDDKKIFIWDYGVPVVIKHISEPELHSVPFVALHPNKKWFLGQSMDNQIVVYSAGNKFKLNAKKHFKGHLSAGYACEVRVSPDGRFVMSGDAHGRVFFWDWKTSRIFSKLKCHHQVTMGCIWHPVMTSKVATCSWDCTIKLWD